MKKADTPQMRGNGLTILLDGLKRPEQGQERFVQIDTPRLHISPDWVPILDNVQEVRLVVEALASDGQSALTALVCPKRTWQWKVYLSYRDTRR